MHGVCGNRRSLPRRLMQQSVTAAFWGGGDDRRPSSKNVLDTTMAWGDILTLLATELVRSTSQTTNQLFLWPSVGAVLELYVGIETVWPACCEDTASSIEHNVCSVLSLCFACRLVRGCRSQYVAFIAL